MILGPRDLEILDALNTKVRVLSLGALAATWWTPTPTGRKNAAKRLAALVEARLLRREVVLARPMLTLASPEFAWFPGERPAVFGALSWRLQARWSGHPRRTVVYFATPRALGLLGGAAPGSIKNLCQVTHDLHVGGVYLAYRRRWPAHAARWQGEDGVARDRRRRETLPDALLISVAGEPYRAVEFGGSYAARRLAAFHDYCRDCGLPYEIW
jgi:hypothetical protein